MVNAKEMYRSPFTNASLVSRVHGGACPGDFENWPYAHVMTGSAFAPVSPTIATQQPIDPRNPEATTVACSPPPAQNFPSQSQYPYQPQTQESPENAYSKLIKSPALSLSTMGVPKHVFKVREATKLILFLGLAAGSVLLLDLTVRLLISIAHNKCNNKSRDTGM